MNRVDVLEKVKGLLLLPNLEMATTQQVADFTKSLNKRYSVLYMTTERS